MKPDGFILKTEVGGGGEGTFSKPCRKSGAEVGLLVLFWSVFPPWIVFPLNVPISIFSPNSFNKHVKHLQHLRKRDQHFEGPRDTDDISYPPGLCFLVEVSVRG